MPFDLSVFLSKENILFSAIYLALVLVVLTICFLIVKAVVKLIIKIFKKIFHKKSVVDQGEDIEPIVEELDKSKKETQRVQDPLRPIAPNPVKMPTIQYSIPISKKAEEDPELSEKEKREKKDESEIASDLENLKKAGKQDGSEPDEESEEERVMGSKIKIPVAKKYGKEGQKPAVSIQDQQAAGYNAPKMELKQQVISQKKVEEKYKDIHEERELTPLEKELEKVYKKADSQKENFQTQKQSTVAGVNQSINKPKDSSIFSQIKSSGQKDDSILFGGKKEILRTDLRQKLRKDPRIWKLRRDLRLGGNTPLERAKLEKETFSAFYGARISKQDLNANIKKLGIKYRGTTNAGERDKLRREIKFWKAAGKIK
jgi:hypothetical protein